ncbi:uncharacterized protein EV420DRAFT_1761906 [Desarmillaria tabescens]|uniref:Transcription factor domain-containing protein n=1 Tax=Armillaria tabescens TaxID=1929756 RepID=A0AA39TWL0_ARMTA|nr:uncharacterized protein EV420DRAFT_1761906 [Desarmillaria tabescens]KAK0461685.1 hypothetical protein EV420DRAFT_1761906 [Desarmillaria tabescens]
MRAWINLFSLQNLRPAKSSPGSSAEGPTLQSAYDLGVGSRLINSGTSSGSPSTMSESPRGPGSDANNEFPRPDNMWFFVPYRLDWSAPLVAIQELAKQPPQDQFHAPVMNDQSISNILSPVEIDHLITLFSVNYTPWLNFTLAREGPTPFLDLVRCTVASRYLDASTRALVAPRLQRLTEDTIARMIFNPELFESQETIKGLIILSLWTPICGPSKGGGRDGRMLISMAVSMALNLGLNEASATAISIRDKVPYDQAALDEATNKARLWITLSTTESMLCIGSRRAPLSRRSPSDMSIFRIISPSNPSEGRDLRIRLLAGNLQCCRTRNGAMDRLSRLILPLSVVLSHEQFYYHMLLLLLQGVRLLVLYHAIHLARTAVRNADGETNMFWFLEGEAVLVSVLQAEKTLLPYNTGHHVHDDGSFLARVTALLEQSVRLLSQVAFSPDHVAHRCSALMDAFHASWIKRQKSELNYMGPVVSISVWHELPYFGRRERGRMRHENPDPDPAMFQDIQFWSTLFGGQSGADSTAYPQSNMRETYN